jgi:beta-lactam-binding protein with PASTA domain
MKDFIIFLKSKLFFKHLAISVACLLVLIWCLIKVLGFYTHHGETAEVPDFKGTLISDLDHFTEGKNIRFLIIDSIYSPNEKSGIVLKQDPEAKTLVKHNRIIYLYVTSTQAPQILMPKLVDKSERQAVYLIESYGLKIGTIKEIAGDCKGCVLQQLINGKQIETGAPIKKGSKIDLYIGKTESDYQTTGEDTTQISNTIEEN